MGEELTRSLNVMAERGEARGAATVLDAARDGAATQSDPNSPTWRRGLVVAFGTAAAVLALIGAVILLARPFGVDVPPATKPPVVPTTVAVTPIPGVESAGPLNDINDLAFAPDGRLWAATAEGLVRWDVTTGDYLILGEKEGVPAGGIQTVEIAPDGTVWVLGDRGIGRYDGSWQVFSGDNVAELNGQLIDLAVDADGVAWASVSSVGIARYDGSWASVPPPHDEWFVLTPDGLAFGPDGTLWAGSHEEGVFAFDGSTWRHFSEADGVPARASNVVAAPGGAVWVWDNGYYTDAELADHVPATGYARFDGSSWTTHTIDDGLLSDEGAVVAAPDGSVWIVHAEFGPDHEPEPIGLSRFDGASWTTYPELDVGRNGQGSGAVVGTDGTVWLPSASGIVGFNGSVTTRLVILKELATPPLSPFTLAEVPDQAPIGVSTVIGDFEFTTMQASPARDFFVFVATPYGPVAFDDGQLRWSADSVTWHGIRTDGNRKWITTDGADVILFGEGFTRYAWEDDGWSKVMEVNLPGAVQSIAFGPNGAVALVDNLVYYSVDGISFALADVGPGEVPGVDRAAGCVIPGPLDAFAGDGNGPILVTETGYVILAPTAANWDQALCEPLVWASTDGNRWELLTERSPFGATAGIRDVAAYAGRFVAVGGFAETEEGAVWVSTDGIDWQRADVDVETALAIDGGTLAGS
jgi:sugar lactone lactonase YvrE